MRTTPPSAYARCAGFSTDTGGLATATDSSHISQESTQRTPLAYIPRKTCLVTSISETGSFLLTFQ